MSNSAVSVQAEHKQRILPGLRRLVVKLGSSIVTTPGGVDAERIGRVVAEVAAAIKDGRQVVIVTSGARAAGLSRLGLSRIPDKIPEQQAAAAIGQIGLMAMYERFFADHGLHVGQVLLTRDDVRDRTRYLNAKHTLDHLLKHGVVPIVNENDSVSIDELKFGDNDTLSALVAGIVEAGLLVLLTDVDGLHESDPRAGASPLVEIVEDVDSTLAALGASGGLSSVAGSVGTGGIASKVKAAAAACHRGIATVIANGHKAGTVGRVLDATIDEGTLFLPRVSPISNRKHWIAYGVPCRGKLTVDAGAAGALSKRGGSLLAAGITAVGGDFRAGDCVGCWGPDGVEFARGLVAYDATDCRKLLGKPSRAIEEVLGYQLGDEVIHRDDLVLLAEVNR